MTKRKRVGTGGRASGSGLKSQDSVSEGSEGREKKRRKRSTSPNDPVSVPLSYSRTWIRFKKKVCQVLGVLVAKIGPF